MDDRRIISRLGYLLLMVSAISLAVFLAFEAIGVAGGPFILDHPWLRLAYLLSISLGPWLAFVLAGVLVYCSLNGSFSRGGFFKTLFLFLGILLVLGVAATTLRNAILVKATSRAPEDHFPLISIFLAIGTGLTLLFIHNGKLRLPGVTFLVVVPALIILAFGSGLRTDPLAITDARAVQIDQAIERYRHDYDSYPVDLADLTSGYLPYLPGPLTGRDQTWCYQAGTDYYRLGYLLFERYHQYEDGTPFWEPYYEIKISGSAGQPPDGTWACDDELENMTWHGDR